MRTLLRENPLLEKMQEQFGGTEKIVESAKHYAGNALSAASAVGHFFVHVLIGFILALVYVLAGFIAAIAAIIYTARLGQAKADAGTGYELFAITAVVLGGTSIFGGKGSVIGTLLGVAAIAVLKSGLACLPVVMRMNAAEEMSGLLTGALLLFALAAGVVPQLWSGFRARARAT
jgi:rhamnose transport system permease protein